MMLIRKWDITIDLSVWLHRFAGLTGQANKIRNSFPVSTLVVTSQDIYNPLTSYTNLLVTVAIMGVR